MDARVRAKIGSMLSAMGRRGRNGHNSHNRSLGSLCAHVHYPLSAAQVPTSPHSNATPASREQHFVDSQSILLPWAARSGWIRQAAAPRSAVLASLTSSRPCLELCGTLPARVHTVALPVAQWPSSAHSSSLPVFLTRQNGVQESGATNRLLQRRGFAVKAGKKVKPKPYSSLKRRFKLLASGEFKRWRAGKRHNASSKTPKQRRQLRRPSVVSPGLAKPMKALNFKGRM